MPAAAAIEVSGLRKSYRTSRGWPAVLERLGLRRPSPPHEVLRDVTFRLERGRALGVLGRNGAGKSTLLQVLAGVLRPSSGEVHVRGRVVAMLELGASFDPGSTGRANAAVQLALFGIPARDQQDKLRQVLEFSELGAAFEEPVATYSSGMFVRLAFAVNVVLEPDVLIVDEVLAVGDVFFQQKCHARLRELRRKGVTVVLVTHAVADVLQHCDEAIEVRDGRIVARGLPHDVVHHYLAGVTAASSGRGAGSVTSSRLPPVEPATNVFRDGCALVGLEVARRDGTAARTFRQGEWARISAEYHVDAPLAAAVAGFALTDRAGVVVHGRNLMHYAGAPQPRVPAGSRLVVRHEVQMTVAPGEYTIHFGVGEATPEVLTHPGLSATERTDRLRPVCYTRQAARIEVQPVAGAVGSDQFIGAAGLPGSCRVEVLAA